LVEREIVFRAGEVNGRDQPEETVICLFEGGFAGKRLPSLDLRKATSLRVSLLNEITFHINALTFEL
jgi:hypothetical protein